MFGCHRDSVFPQSLEQSVDGPNWYISYKRTLYYSLVGSYRCNCDRPAWSHSAAGSIDSQSLEPGITQAPAWR
jgi:hypothetical protein